MKIRIAIIIIAILMLYMILPIGDYNIDDVNINTMNNKSTSMRMSVTEFVEKVEETINQEISSMVIPITTVGRDGKENDLKIRINSGKNYFNGGSHGALDIFTDGVNPTASCKFSKSCSDVALIAPFTGTINKIIYRSDDTNNFNNYGVKPKWSTVLSISGSGVWTGYVANIIHFTGLNPDLKVGGTINQGDFIGFYCSQGNSTAPHLHYDLYQGTAKIKDPGLYIDSLVWHSSVKEAYILSQLNVPRDSGFTLDQFNNLGSRERYESVVTIPSKYKID